MSIQFVASRQFNDFALLSRAFAVAVEGEFRAGQTEIEVHALENAHLNNLLIQLVDSTRDFLTQKGIQVNVVQDPIGYTTLVSLGDLPYYPHKAVLYAARNAEGITVLEY